MERASPRNGSIPTRGSSLIRARRARIFSDTALARNLAGACGHYLLFSQDMIERHHRQGQKVGTGFIVSRFGFYRELNRGVDWVFTNNVLELEAIRQQLLLQA